MNGKVILAGQETNFTDSTTATSPVGYYVTAVDVAGKESAPSKGAYTDGTSMDLLALADGNNTGSQGNSKDKNDNNETKPGGSTPSGPAKEVPAAPSGLTIKANGNSLMMQWKANPDKDKVKQYSIYYSDKENGNYKKLGNVLNGTEFRYFAAEYDGYYKISAVNELGESKLSAPVHYKK